ncbi:MAG: acetyl-CoA carboxylase biotin carboxyl carrier protein subunit [Oscillospiraceae bacterium]|nr:acetyl-CoA carboxylase biotin carboxyl carrier protein subunit [Oscillospiraceae bacterium]
MKQFKITVNGVTYDVAVEETGSSAPVFAASAAPVAPAAPAAVPAPAAAPAEAPAATPAALPENGKKIGAPMPGSIVDVCVSVGQTVAAGDKLIVLESMKMENDIVAEKAGTVLGIGVSKGDMVNAGDTLLVLG